MYLRQMQLRLLFKQKRSVAGMRNVVLVQETVERLNEPTQGVLKCVCNCKVTHVLQVMN